MRRPSLRSICVPVPTLRLAPAIFTLLLLSFVAAPVAALDPVKAAENMARQAAAAFEQGDHQRAAQLYMQAYASDAATLDYVYGAARAEHVANKLDQAELHYEEYIKKGGKGTRLANANKYLLEVRSAKAEIKASDAERAVRMDNPLLAAQLFHSAFDMAPQRWDFLYRESMVREQAGQKPEAKALLARYLRDAPADAHDREEAKARFAVLDGKPAVKPAEVPKPAEVAKPQLVSPVVVQPPVARAVAEPLPAAGIVSPRAEPPQDQGSARALAWTTTAVGAAVALTGLGLAVWAQLDQSSLQKQLTPNGAGLIDGISYSEAQARVSANDNRRLAGEMLGGVGVLATATGAWLLWRAYPGDAHVTVAPTPSSLQLLVRF